MPDGYVALLDVLGFSNLVAARGAEGVGRYLDCLNRACQATRVDYVVFSDSIVLTVESIEAASLTAIAGACSRLMHEMLMQDIPIRGAISSGEFLRKRAGESVFVAGRAVIDAYQFEQAQDWVGVMIAPSARQTVPDLDERCALQNRTQLFEELAPRLDWAASIHWCPSIPFHAENPFASSSFDGFAIVPHTGDLDPAALRDSLREAIGRLKWLRGIAPTPAAQMKYQHATNWLSAVQQLWHDVAFFREQAGQR